MHTDCTNTHSMPLAHALAGASAFSRQLDLPIRRDYIYITPTKHCQHFAPPCSTLPSTSSVIPLCSRLCLLITLTFQSSLSLSLVPTHSCVVWCNTFPVCQHFSQRCCIKHQLKALEEIMQGQPWMATFTYLSPVLPWHTWEEVSLHACTATWAVAIRNSCHTDSQIRQHAAAVSVLVSDRLGDRGNMAPSCTNAVSCYEMGLQLLAGSLSLSLHDPPTHISANKKHAADMKECDSFHWGFRQSFCGRVSVLGK